MSMNKVILQGRLTADVELRRTQSGTPVGSFNLAVDRDVKPQNGERETDFVSCVVWGFTAEFASSWFHKGDQALICGRLQSRKWTDRDGNNRVAWEVVVESLNFCGSKRDREEDEYAQAERDGKNASDKAVSKDGEWTSYEQASENIELPF